MSLVDILACPACKSSVDRSSDRLRCQPCGRDFPIKNGVPIMLLDPSRADVQNEGELTRREGYDPWLHRMVIQSLTDDRVVVDAGCGDMALDDPCIIRMDTRLTPYVDVVGDLHALPFKRASIDYVFALAVVEHLRQPFLAAEEIHAALRPGGYVYAECNFVFAYHGYPHHYFNASIHGMEQVFSRFRALRVGVAPYQAPAFALESLLSNYLEFFQPESAMQIQFAQLLRHVLTYPIRSYDGRIRPDVLFRFAAGVYFYGIKQSPAAETLIPSVVMDVYRRTPELHARFPAPEDLSRPDNLLFWAKREGPRHFPEIARYFETLTPFSKHDDRGRDRSQIDNLAPIVEPDQQRIEEPDVAERERAAMEELFAWANHPSASRPPLLKRVWQKYREQGVMSLAKKTTPHLRRTSDALRQRARWSARTCTSWLQRVARRGQAQELAGQSRSIYETLYDGAARLHSEDDVVGAGAFDLIGRLELSVLLMEGLKPTDTVVDFGCGTGRLAVHLIPYLVGGHYIGIDISRRILEAAERRVEARVPVPPCKVTWLHQTAPRFELAEGEVDLLCAFSVFTHLEHEDAYRYLTDAFRIVRPDGRFIFSCLPLDLQVAREIFVASASVDFQQRWSVVRNVTTSRDLMDAMARLAGWTPVRWYPGDRANITVLDSSETSPFGQSICVLKRPNGGASGAADAHDPSNT